MTADPDLAGVGRSRRAHLWAIVVLAALVAVTDGVVEADQVIMAVLFGAATLAGFLRPDGIIAAGLGIGLAIPAVHAVTELFGIRAGVPSEPPGMLGAVSLVVLVVPALIGAVLGGFARRTLEEERLRRR